MLDGIVYRTREKISLALVLIFSARLRGLAQLLTTLGVELVHLSIGGANVSTSLKSSIAKKYIIFRTDIPSLTELIS